MASTMEDISSYHDLKIDPKEILQYLNELGIQNINGAMLKEFITDLKRLIKFDLRHKKTNAKPHFSTNPESSVFERLYSATTVSCRNRMSQREGQLEKKKVEADNQSQLPIEKIKLKSCHVFGHNKKTAPERKIASNCNLIRIPIKKPLKRSDPVTLYHYYLALWEKYKDNMPGENNWAEIRWRIKQKLMSDPA